MPVVSSPLFSAAYREGNWVSPLPCPPPPAPHLPWLPGSPKAGQGQSSPLAIKCPTQVQSACPLPGANSHLFSSLGHIQGTQHPFLGHISHCFLFACFIFCLSSSTAFSTCSRGQTDGLISLAKMKFKNHLKVNGMLRCFSSLACLS